MNKRTQTYVLVGLVLILAYVLLRGQGSPESGIILASQGVPPKLEIADPSLNLAALQRIRKLEYSGTHRNIFSASAPEPVVAQQKAVEPPVQVADPRPVGPPPLEPPFRFYGLTTDTLSGRKRAFFTNGDDIWIASEGQMIGPRFRLLSFGNTTAEVEEVATGRRATMRLEEQAAPPS
jgi:hypothetical protein